MMGRISINFWEQGLMRSEKKTREKHEVTGREKICDTVSKFYFILLGAIEVFPRRYFYFLLI